MPNSVNRFVPDAAFRIRAADAAALTASTKISAGLLVNPVGAPWNDAVQDGKVVFFLQGSEIAATGTYEVVVITSANEDLSSAQAHQKLVINPAVTPTKWLELLVDQVALLNADSDAKYYGIEIVVGGTTPSIKVEAYVLPPVGK